MEGWACHAPPGSAESGFRCTDCVLVPCISIVTRSGFHATRAAASKRALEPHTSSRQCTHQRSRQCSQRLGLRPTAHAPCCRQSHTSAEPRGSRHIMRTFSATASASDMPGYEGMHTHSHEDMLRQVEVKSKAANKRELHAVNVGTPGFYHISMIENSTLAAPWG